MTEPPPLRRKRRWWPAVVLVLALGYLAVDTYVHSMQDPKFPIYSCGKDRIDNSGAEGSDDLASWR